MLKNIGFDSGLSESHWLLDLRLNQPQPLIKLQTLAVFSASLSCLLLELAADPITPFSSLYVKIITWILLYRSIGFIGVLCSILTRDPWNLVCFLPSRRIHAVSMKPNSYLWLSNYCWLAAYVAPWRRLYSPLTSLHAHTVLSAITSSTRYYAH